MDADIGRLNSSPVTEEITKCHRVGNTRLCAQVVIDRFDPFSQCGQGRCHCVRCELALNEAETLRPKPKIVVFAAFQFDPEAAKDIDETNWAGVTLLKAQMNADLLTEDLKKKRASNDSFWLIGQPDVELVPLAKGEDKGKYRVSVNGFDYYNTKTGNIESGSANRIAMWMLDPDYDSRSLFPRQVFFIADVMKDGLKTLADNLRAEIDENLIKAYFGTTSLAFPPGKHNRAAVKIIDDRGIESFKVIELD